jgi:hypothetical protein
VSPSFRLVVASAVVALGLSHAVPSRAQDLRGEIEAVVREYLARHPEDVERIVKEYLLKHPEVVQQILADLIRRPSAGPAPAPAPAPDKVATIKSVAAALFNSPHQVTLGNPQGDVTLVEFFDYNCGFCKRSLADLLGLMQSDANLKICSRNGRSSDLARSTQRAWRLPCACRIQAARSISNSTASCSALRATSTRPAHLLRRPRSASTRRGSKRT